ncbi:type II toxin-antitoxin system VapC family toxin [soil metagenome]
MTRALAYLDTSAFAKLPLHEPERAALLHALETYTPVSSWLLAVEAVRACARYGRDYADAARAGLERVSLLPLDEQILRRAQMLPPPQLRTLDALHLATALSIAADLAVLVTYDDRLAEAATAAGVTVIAPC